MTESSRNYQNAKVYSIRNWVDGDIYVGSTVQPLSKRFEKHRSNCKSEDKKNRPLYYKMNELGVENFYIELIEKVECNDIHELRQKEGEWIRQIGNLNYQIAGRTLKEKNATYYQNNREKCAQMNKDWKDRNKEHHTQVSAQYYQDNKVKIRQRRNTPNKCDCGGRYTNRYKAEHFRTKRHQDYLNNNINNVEIQKEEHEIQD